MNTCTMYIKFKQLHAHVIAILKASPHVTILLIHLLSGGNTKIFDTTFINYQGCGLNYILML